MTTCPVLELALQGGDPIEEQLARQLRRHMEAHQVLPGQELPTIREVAVALAINPATVARAYQQLEREGFVRMNEGSGVFVTSPTSEQSATESADPLWRYCEEFLRAMAHRGYAPQAVLHTVLQMTQGVVSHENAP